MSVSRSSALLAFAGLVGMFAAGQSWRVSQLASELDDAQDALSRAEARAESAERAQQGAVVEAEQLRSRVEGLEARELFEEDAAKAGVAAKRRVKTKGSGASLLVVGASGEVVEVAAGSDAGAIDQAVDAVIERAKESRLDEEGEAFVKKSTAKLEAQLDALVAAGTLEEADRSTVVDLMEGQAHEVWELKADVQRGELSETDAVAEYEEIRAGYRAALGEIVKPEAVTAVMDAKGAGKGK